MFRTITEHYEFVGLWQDGVPKLGVMKVRGCGSAGREGEVLTSAKQSAVLYLESVVTCMLCSCSPSPKQAYRLQADAPRGFYRLPKRVDVGEVNECCDLQGG